MTVNPKQLQTYQKIFGIEKMLYLWREYLEQSDAAWAVLDELDWNLKRSKFHNWRSSSLVFGMETFARMCTLIEENILKKRFEQLPNQIKESKTCYENSILEVKQIMQQTEAGHE